MAYGSPLPAPIGSNGSARCKSGNDRTDFEWIGYFPTVVEKDGKPADFSYSRYDKPYEKTTPALRFYITTFSSTNADSARRSRDKLIYEGPNHKECFSCEVTNDGALSHHSVQLGKRSKNRIFYKTPCAESKSKVVEAVWTRPMPNTISLTTQGLCVVFRTNLDAPLGASFPRHQKQPLHHSGLAGSRIAR